ncbi:helix-turn-helix domain-containing protein [Paenibacillus roseipurpureus]|uniref:Helix-turn-helix domain-containing protein n=1 Tax=Paenibacillus roseopurpureus TaxID=2918901 RepID=A0AA96LPX1_9BACL|nr:helix-turn-helix domain-containing protein [Paenibacillus sp. MBLB1832]WNR43648.1 helix-turn-helix domain-containing protein [Paenibacillus sp. MBLB1832]
MSIEQFNLISMQEALDLLGVSRSTFDRWRKWKQLPFMKIGKEILIDKGELEKWVRHHAVSLEKPALVLGGATSMMSTQERAATITVGYQSGTAHMWTSLIMKELGWFEEELASIPARRAIQVNWFDGAGGTVLVQGILGGSVQIASLGDYPITICNSMRQMFPGFSPVMLAFDGKTSGGQGISLVVRKELEIKDVSEICNWSLASAPQTSAGRRLSKLLRSLGGNDHRVVHQGMDESMAGIVKRKIAGSAMWEPYISLAKHNGIGQVLFQEGLGEDYLTGVVADEQWALNHEAETVAYLKAHLRVHRFIREDTEAAANLISRIKGIPADVAGQILSRVRWDASFYEKDLQTLVHLQEEDQIGQTGASKPPEIHTNCSYLIQAAKALGLPPLSRTPLQQGWSIEQLY